ncbi:MULTISPECIES: hypothetical protein [Streptomyces]|uniref:Lipoprotein n=1 Tax=Streptomyces rutgersensis TaxID=53451 RepID=A0ABX6RN42_9ACTN|nr:MULTISPECIES: hypothetical protein [Streptomyces]MDQ0294740.1 hypothetical protein [Streptomyces sp. DSM 41037]NEE39465.1 hypothetical protein [Streptomyces sp. SID7982]QNE82107.1 hypothetical protein F0345_14080 [Streptomyces rutgersensis]WPR52078.1 hypothetical protein SJI45_14555 [Streptomyces sp. S399]
MRTKAIIGFVAVAALVTGCSLESEPPADHTITHTALPSDDDQQRSKKSAEAFLAASADDGTIASLQDAVTGVFGEWEKGSDRAFIATTLYGSRATPENGKLIANAFGVWQNSESGEGRVFVYGKDEKLLYQGKF